MRILSTMIIAALPLLVAGCSAIEATARQGTVLIPPEPTGDAWFDAGATAVFERKKRYPGGEQKARNVILFIGDGMDINTVTAARIFDGQARGVDGEANDLAFETLPHVAFAKTYTTDYQTPDSAGTATAMVAGVKTRSGVLSVNKDVVRGDCAASLTGTVETILEQAEAAGLSTGVVSTAELTHATPASAYAHVPDRGWGFDGALPAEAVEAGCKDIARQLIEFEYGDGLEIAMGGGRAHFLPADQKDPEYPEQSGRRNDGRDLASEWSAKSSQHVTVWNKADFEAAPANAKILGLFEPRHMQFEADRPDDGAGEPSLAAMTTRAIQSLSANDNGYFLMVEAGRIDHAHHGGNAYRALKDTQAYSEAVAAALKATDDDDTLIIVTADHGHTMALQGYPKKGADILGLAVVDGPDGEIALMGTDGKPYTTLVYANGYGSLFQPEVDLSAGRPTPENVGDKNYMQQALIPTGSETHGAQDVPVYAGGPNAHLVSGVMEQNVIYHIMADALGL